MNNMLSYLIQNKRRIAKCLYLAAALIENIPDFSDGLKRVDTGIITSRIRSRGKRPAHK
jgi:hypothetical protein